MSKYLTPEGLKKFKKELDYLENIKRKELSETIKDAASQGDLKENAGYHAAKEEQGFVEGRIKELKGILSQAKVIEKKDSDKIQIGSFVSLESFEEDKSSSRPSPRKRGSEDSEKDGFQIVEPEEADILDNKISFKSPLGNAILNRKKGDIVEVDTPGGKKEYKIIKIV
jgi:transcription elongation factor GreA